MSDILYEFIVQSSLYWFFNITIVGIVTSFTYIINQAGVKHVILAVSYRAELLENEMKEQEERVSTSSCVLQVIMVQESGWDNTNTIV